MGLAWFRMYAKFMTDPDVEELSFEDQRHFIYVLCMKCDGLLDKDFGDAEKRERAIARRLGLQGEAFTNTKIRLIASKLMGVDWQPRSWEALQFKSDHDAAERQRRSRENRHVTTMSRDSHPLEQNRTDTDTEQREERAVARQTATRIPADFSLTPERRVVAEAETLPADRTFAKFCDYWRAASGAKARKHDWDATWRNWCRSEADRNGGTGGTNRTGNKPRLSAVERVYAATAHLVGDSGRVGVEVDGGNLRTGVPDGLR